MKDQVKSRLLAVKLVVFDVDGVMTDGRLYFSAEGQSMKAFDVKDGHGIRLLIHYGIAVAVISGRQSEAVARRLDDLGVTQAYLGFPDKRAAFAELLSKNGLAADQVAYMGDDLPDLCLMTQAGFACTVADAHPEVMRYAHWASNHRGGCGAVRELCELLLKEHGHWNQVLEYCLSKN